MSSEPQPVKRIPIGAANRTNDPRFGEKVRTMALAILDAWPDDHNIPIPQDPNRSCVQLMQEMAASMAIGILYAWSSESPLVEFPEC